VARMSDCGSYSLQHVRAQLSKSRALSCGAPWAAAVGGDEESESSNVRTGALRGTAVPIGPPFLVAPRRRRSRKHTALPLLQTIQTLRSVSLHRAAAPVHASEGPTLRLANNAATRRLYMRIEGALARAS
jgi:hypothetical protein